jgi:hypothetical protein
VAGLVTGFPGEKKAARSLVHVLFNFDALIPRIHTDGQASQQKPIFSEAAVEALLATSL